MADYKTLSGLDLDISGYTESVTRSKKTLEEVSRKNRGIGAKPETETVELDNNFLEGIAQLFRDNGYEPKQPSEDTTTTPKDEVLEEYSKLMKSEIIQDAMKELSTLGESPNKLEDIYTSMDTDFVTLENQPTVDSEGDTLDIRQTEPLGLMSKVVPVTRSDKPVMAKSPSQPELKASIDTKILSPRFLNAIGITASLTEKGVQAEVKKILKEQGMSDEEITNLVNKSLAAIDADEVQPTDGKDPFDPNSFTQKHLEKVEAGGYDTLFGNAEKTSKDFKGVKITDMSIGELIEFTKPSGPYGKWVKPRLPKDTEAYQRGLTSTPLGKYQIVGTTLRKLVKDYGWSLDDKFTKKVQDRMFLQLAYEALDNKESMGEKVRSMRKVWEGLREGKGSTEQDVIKIIKEIESTRLSRSPFPRRKPAGIMERSSL